MLICTPEHVPAVDGQLKAQKFNSQTESTGWETFND